MGLHEKFPRSPYEILDPQIRWFPADEELRNKDYGKLLPPLVDKLRKEVFKWRTDNYPGISDTSRSLLKWWFERQHSSEVGVEGFRYYFAQRETVETVIYLYEVVNARSKYDLLRYDSSGAVSTGMFPEDWLRLVIKMATGSGKTKVMSLLIAWSYFHKLYEDGSELARNFLLITPNIIVLDRIRADFEGLKIFNEDPIIPDNGYGGQNWHDDFQIAVHTQDNVSAARGRVGNLFLTNIHRIYSSGEKVPSIDDDDTSAYFLGPKPVTSTNESMVDVGEIVRDIDELMILNDEAHHIHDDRLAWFKSIGDIAGRMKMKDRELSLQVDLTATPKHNNGTIFVQTISDYPLVEAIRQDVVKHPVIPDAGSRAALQEYPSPIFTKKYRDYLHLGYEEWKKVYARHLKVGKKAVLFVMTDDTVNCDDVNDYLQETYPEFRNAVLTIHTNRKGEIVGEKGAKKDETELKRLRDAANNIDNPESPYRAIVSVLMLKEGWDVRNVTTIVGLRAYNSKSKVLPEQTLGRGLRRMYRDSDEVVEEYVSIVGTDAFMDFVESVKDEGVELELSRMGQDTPPKAPLVVEIDKQNLKKDIEKLDIPVIVLTPRIQREYRKLKALTPAKFEHKRLVLKQFNANEVKEISFREITTGREHHKTDLVSDDAIGDYREAVTYFARGIKKDLRLVSGYDVLYGKVKEFMQNHLFGRKVDLNDRNTLRNLTEVEAYRTIIETFKKEINALTVVDSGDSEVKSYIRVSKTRPFVTRERDSLIPLKSVFNRIVGDSHFELEFARFLEGCDDVIAYAKNYLAVGFKIDYQNSDGDISNYYPDFLVKLSEREVYVVETKGREDLDDLRKKERLYQWCEDANVVQSEIKYSALYVEQDQFENYRAGDFAHLTRVLAE